VQRLSNSRTYDGTVWLLQSYNDAVKRFELFRTFWTFSSQMRPRGKDARVAVQSRRA